MSIRKEDEIIIIGAGEFAEIAYEYFMVDSPYKVVAFSAEKKYIDKEKLFDLPIIPFEELDNVYSPNDYKAFVAITFTGLNRVRTRLYKEAKKKGYKFVSYISSHAFVWRNVKIGENSFIFENNVLQYFVEIGNNVILWSGNHIGHRSIIKDNCFVSSHVVISGYCEIGEKCFLGVNCSLIPHIKIANDCVIGAGAVVLKNTEKGKVYIGNPAKPILKSSYKLYKISNE